MNKVLIAICPFCGIKHSVEVDQRDWNKYKSGHYTVQECFPYLSPDQRELILTGICKECWGSM